MESKKVKLLNNLSFVSLLGALFLSLFFFLPYSSISSDASKGFLISVGVTLSIFFWLMARLIDGKFTVPKDRLILFFFSIPVVFLLSSFFSKSPYLSFFGRQFEVGTFGSMLVLFLIFFLSATYFQTEKRFKYFFSCLWVGFSFLALFEVVHMIFGIDKLLPGMFKSLNFANLFGSWGDFVTLLGVMIVLSLISLQFLKLSKIYKIGIYLSIVFSLFFLFLVNSVSVWILTGIFALIIFVYGVSFANKDEDIKEKTIPMASFFVILVTLIALLSHDFVSVFVSNYFGFINNDISPALMSTFSVAKHALMHNPFFGTGPNTFSMDWSMYKPVSVFQSPYGSVDFPSGFGFIPTLLSTVGIFGLLSFLFFLWILFFRGLQSLRVALKNSSSNFLIVSTLSISFYLWISAFISNPNFVLLSLASLSSGIFIGVLVYKKVIPIYDFSFLKDPRISFFSIFGLVVLMIASITATYVYTEKFIGLSYVSSNDYSNPTVQTLAKSESNLLKALALDHNDNYYKILSQVYLSHINVLASDKTATQESLKSSLQSLVSNAENTAGAAITQNNSDYSNWLNLANLYSSFVSMNVSGAYDNALNAYAEAFKRSPNNPTIYFGRGVLNYNNANYTDAISDLEKAVTYNLNYYDARYFLSLAYQKAGRIDDAKKQLNILNTVIPNNKIIESALSNFSNSSLPSPQNTKITDKVKKLPAKNVTQ